MSKSSRTCMQVVKAKWIIEHTEGKFFTIHFYKRSDGSLRKMTARTGVKKGVKGTGMKYNPEQHNLQVVFDIRQGEFRAIPLDQIVSIKFRGQTYQ